MYELNSGKLYKALNGIPDTVCCENNGKEKSIVLIKRIKPVIVFLPANSNDRITETGGWYGIEMRKFMEIK